MKKTIFIYALVLLVALTAIMAVAQGQKRNSPANQPAGSSIPRCANPPMNCALGCPTNCQQALGLSQNQVAEMTRIRTAFIDGTANLRTDLQARMKEIADLWTVADPDLQLIKQKSAEADQVRAQIRDKAIDARGATLKLLTPQQREKCIKMCQSGQCTCGMCGCGACGMNMGACGMGAGNAAGACPMGTGTGKGCGMGKGRCGGCPMK